jgi:hypothetical protein
MLVPAEPLGPAPYNARTALFLCSCGKAKRIRIASVLSHRAKSCGCKLGQPPKHFVMVPVKMALAKACKLTGVGYSSVVARINNKYYTPQEAFDFFMNLRKENRHDLTKS